ncbi:MAG: aldose 1-epimerase family protein [Acidimicrobiales bacterium]
MTPSGREVEIGFGDQTATIVEVGGGLRTYEVAGEHVLDGFESDEMCPSGRGQALLPWPNRIAGGVYDFDGARQQLPLTEPARQNAIHGLTRFANWNVAEVGAARVVMEHRLHPQPGYPFLLDLCLDYRLDEDGLTVRCLATNRGPTRCPFGAGAHPYIRIGAEPIDDLRLSVSATTRYEADDRGIPTCAVPVAASPYDFRQPRAIGALSLDTAFTDLARDVDGRASVAIEGRGRRVTVWMGPRFTDLMLYSGDTLGELSKRRRALAIEPMTCPPNAFQSGERVIVLEPGEGFDETWGISSRSTR